MTPPSHTVSTKVTVPEFRAITTADIKRLSPILRRSRSRSCDFTVGGVFMWIDYFGYQADVIDNTLFIKGLSEDIARRPSFSLPVGDMPLSKAVEHIRRYCRATDMTPLLSVVPQDRLAELEALGVEDVEELPDWADYIYRARDLADLPGKAYSKKRNHVNRFTTDNPAAVLEPIDSHNIGEVIDFFSGMDIESAKADPVMAEYEREQTLEVLRNFGTYGLEGACLRTCPGGPIVAFTAGEVCGDTLILHIEKMEHMISGVGETINKLFATRMLSLHPEIEYINREDDAGDPGLRFAKESYHPVFRLKKYNVTLTL